MSEFDFLDFNSNDKLDPAELFVGASIASSFAYGAGLAEAEERECRRYSDYEDEYDDDSHNRDDYNSYGYDNEDEWQEDIDDLDE